MMKTLLSLFIAVIWLSGVQSAEQLTQSDPVVITPGNSHTLTCKASGFTFSSYGMHWVREIRGKLQWIAAISTDGGSTYYHDDFKGRFTISRANNDNMLNLKMDNMKTEDTAVYYCARDPYITGVLDIWGQGTLVTVTSAEKSAPSVFPLVPCCQTLSSLPEITIGCLSTGYLPETVDVTWNSGSITTGIKNLPGILSKNGNYISTSLITISASDWKSKKYTCNVDHKESSKINKDIPSKECGGKSSPPTMEVMLSSCGINNWVELICLISGYALKDINIKWLQDEKEIPNGQYNNNQYGAIQGNLTSSKLSVPKQDWDKGTIYTCVMNHRGGSTTEKKIISKCPDPTSQTKIVLHPPSRKDLLITKEPKLTCEVSGITSKATLQIKWKRSDGKSAEPVIPESFNGSATTYTVNSTLKISKSDWDAQVSFTCITEHSTLPSPIERSIKKRVPLKEPTIYILPPSPTESTIKDQLVGITCRLEGFNHKDIYVGWAMSHDSKWEGPYINTEPMLTDDGETYVMFSRLLVSQEYWNNGATFVCLGGLERISRKEIKIGNKVY